MRCVLHDSGSGSNSTTTTGITDARATADACSLTSTGIADTRSTADVCPTTNIGMWQLGIECEQRLQISCGMGNEHWNT
jgi:hypothetical protein